MRERADRWSGWLVTSALLVVGVPLFLRMPLWSDATLYTVAARTVSTGGVHYRDVFDTNPPGFVWALCAVRGVLGTGDLALRAADLLIVALVVAGLAWWSRKAGASAAGGAWLAAAAAALYPFVHEFNHVQRDTWMMLPAGAAIALRLARSRPTPQPPPSREGASDPSRAADVGESSKSEAPSLQGGGWGVGSSLLLDLWVTQEGTARPDELLRVLNLTDLIDAGAVLERSAVELRDEVTPTDPTDGPPDGPSDSVPLTGTEVAALAARLDEEAANQPPAEAGWGASPNGPVVE